MTITATTRNTSARFNESALLRAAGEVTYARLALAVQHDASYITRFFQDQQKLTLSELLMVLDVCGLALTRDDPESVTIPRKELEGLALFARKGLEASYSVGQMLQESA